jgi:GNAT superfamily N-acetyltransferase
VSPAPLEVRPLSGRAELMRFIRLPWAIYRNEPRWIPPLVFERKRFLDRRSNPFFEHGEAEYFLAWRGATPVGRITAQIDHAFNAHHGNDWGMFGFFEAVRDQEVASALLAAAEGWLAARGRGRIVGPMDFTMNDEAGLLIEGHELKPMLKQPWQHPYYQPLLEDHGLTKAEDLLMWNLEVSDRERMLPVLFELAERLEPDHGIKLRHLSKRHFRDEIRRFVEVYNAAWKDNWGFVPISESEMEHTARELKPLLDENWMMAAEKDGETVGIALTVRDFNQVLEKLNGRVLPLGWLRGLWQWRRIDRVRVGFLGVKPEYQHTGVAAAFYVEHFEMAARTRQDGGEMGWILESNIAMNRAMEAMGGRVVKRYRLYERELRPPA